MDAWGEGRDQGLASGIFEDFRALFGDDQRAIPIEDLARLEAHWPITAGGQRGAVEVQHRHHLGFLDRFQGATDMPFLPTRFTFAGSFPSPRTVRVGRRRLAAIPAIEAQALGA